MFARGIIVLLCVLVAISDGARAPNCKDWHGACPKDYIPLCGSDGIIYDNECMLCVAIKESGTEILIQHEGECEIWRSNTGMAP